MGWHKISLTKDQIEEQGAIQTIEKQFEKLFIDADGPLEMALLSENEYTDDKISIYFTPVCSPSCDELISQYDGNECEPPSIDHVFLLDGDDEALDLLSTI